MKNLVAACGSRTRRLGTRSRATCWIGSKSRSCGYQKIIIVERESPRWYQRASVLPVLVAALVLPLLLMEK